MKRGTIRKKIAAIENKVKKHVNDKRYNISPRVYVIVISIIAIGIIVSLFIIFSSLKRTTTIGENMDASLVDVSKQAVELKTEYEKEGNADKFADEYNKVQNAIGMYILDNSTLDNNSFEKILKELKKIVSKADWSKLNIEKPIYWAGTWLLDDSGNIKFKFKTKTVEPSWIRQDLVSNMIILN